MKAEPQKSFDACLEFFTTVVKGYILAAACEELKVPSLSSPLLLPSNLKKSTKAEQLRFIDSIAELVVSKCFIVDGCFSGDALDIDDSVFNYGRILGHFGALVLEMTDAWSAGDGERVFRCWRRFLPHFQAANHTKYALEALNFQFQVTSVCSPHLAHHIMWDRFVNSKGGSGRNIPCDLYNEHANKSLKYIFDSMGSNVTEKSLKKAARCTTKLMLFSKSIDSNTNVPTSTTAHSSVPDIVDVAKVVEVVLKERILHVVPSRTYSIFRRVKSNPLWNWHRESSLEWIEKKKRDYVKGRRIGDEILEMSSTDLSESE